VLSERELNRAALARQLLLERVRMPLPRVLEAVAGLQAQYAPSMYVGLWSRVEGFTRPALTAALENRTVIQATLMRATIHLVSAADYWPCAHAVRGVQRSRWLATQRGLVTEQDMTLAATQLATALSEGPLRRAQIDSLIGRERAGGVGLWVDLVRVPPSGTWERRRADLYGLASSWLPESPATTPGGGGRADRAVEHVVTRYLGGFGPATAAEVADWAGLPIAQVTPVLRRLTLCHFETTDGQQLFDLAGAPLPDPATAAPVRFLPVWEAVLLVHARGTGVVAEEHRRILFTSKNPHSVNTFLVDGRVAGTWRYDAGAIEVNPFASLNPTDERQLAQEAERLAAFHA
jgi:Winged helix DNA-binding domain